LLASLTGGALFGQARQAQRRDPVLALVQRITQGFDLAEYERARSMGYQAYLEEQLDHLAIDDSAMDARLAGYTTLGMSPKQLYDTYATDYTEPYFQFKGAVLLRSVHSKRQLFERMCEFWNDHFSIDHNKGDVEWMLLPEFDRTVIRAHALGSFPDMLAASAFSGAMLYYLDNWLNVRGAPQENYARELMELHTLGVDGGYTEDDVVEVARCFTGWTLNSDYASPDYLRGQFVNDYHAGGDKVVLGVTIPALPPRQNAHRVLEILVAHPSTARFIATKLIRWFLSEDPPQGLVDRVAQVFTDTNGDIKSMLRVILARENFSFTSTALGPKFRRPFHLVTSVVRALDGRLKLPREPAPVPTEVLEHLEEMGHVPFDHPQPDGYADTTDAWGTAPLPRWGFVSRILDDFGDQIGGLFLIQPDELRARLGFLQDPDDRPGLAQRMNELFFGGTLTVYQTRVLQGFIDDYAAPFGNEAFYDSLALGACMPGFQWY
jgi:uncharacterized protein (DUF1800 family)